MIATSSLLYKIDQRLNKLSTFSDQNIPLEDKILLLNEGQLSLIKTKIDGNNVYKLGLDAFKKRYQDLQFLIENAEDHSLTPTLSDKHLNKWIVDVTTISPKYMFYLDSYLIADKEECKDRIITTNRDLVKHADISILLNNTNYKPSFEYQETIVDMSSDEIHYYTDGTFTLKKAYLSYIRYPKYIDSEGYIKFDGTESVNQNCELEDYLEDELLDIVIRNIAMFTDNQPAIQSAIARQQTNE